jgi:hypothetical protein
MTLAHINAFVNTALGLGRDGTIPAERALCMTIRLVSQWAWRCDKRTSSASALRPNATC